MFSVANTPDRQRPRAAWGLLWRGIWIATALVLLGWAVAAPNWDQIQKLAAEQYGAAAEKVIVEWRQMVGQAGTQSDVDKLNTVNTFFNKRVRFEDDIVVWKQEDYWASPLEFVGKSAGDCEDFAIAKYTALLMLGVSNDKLRLVYVKAKMGTRSVAHMVLGYYASPSEEPLILDNLVGSVRPASGRPDLSPVFSFNNEGLWVAGSTASSADPTARLSRWRDVLDRMRQHGFN